MRKRLCYQASHNGDPLNPPTGRLTSGVFSKKELAGVGICAGDWSCDRAGSAVWRLDSRTEMATALG